MKRNYLILNIIIAFCFILYACNNSGNSQDNQTDNSTEEEVIEESAENTQVTEEEQSKPIEIEANTVLIKLPAFSVKFANSVDESILVDKSDLMESAEIDIELFLMYASELFNAEFSIVPGDQEFTIDKIEQQYATTLFFNEDGSGGVWTIEGIDVAFSDWYEILKDEAGFYTTFGADYMAETKPEISEESYNKAEEFISGKEVETTYTEYSSNNILKITWSANNQTYETTLNFFMTYGD